ncbi:MAG: hypothetical protein IPL95_16870 [Saprospiraceae bacterium]|nr:hypothetical protein [Saprospiraceae bacterium]
MDILEINLSKRIKIFYEAYYLRIVNEHSIENVGDFFIHNAQFQTIATIYDNLVKILGNHILGNHKGDKIVATFDDNTTIVNSINIKLSTYNLMEPGLILTYIFKEIITVFVDQNLKPNIENLNSEIKKAYDIYFTEYPTDPLIHYQNTLYQIKSDYFLTDFLRYKIFYEISNDDIDNEGISKDFKLFYYWHLANFLQFPKTYRLIGDVFKENFYRMLSTECFS